MFDNVSQIFFNTGAIGYLLIVPFIRSLASLFMIVSTYKLLKARRDEHKFLWLVVIWASPILGRIGFEVYRRWILKKETTKVKGSAFFLFASITAFIISAVLMIISFTSMGIGFIKSEIDGEPLASFYDIHGNEYDSYNDVPLYDKEGNIYTYEPDWFSGTYTDQNGKTYDSSYCYLSEDGYFYFDEKEELEPYENSIDYYTDGETIYYLLFNYVYWDDNGTIYQRSGKLPLELFDFDN